MREQDIRKVLADVCETLDRHRSAAGALAVSASLALVVSCGSSGTPVYSAPVDSSTTTDTTAIDSPALRYMTQFEDSSTSGETDAANETAIDSANTYPAYMAVFDSATSD